MKFRSRKTLTNILFLVFCTVIAFVVYRSYSNSNNKINHDLSLGLWQVPQVYHVDGNTSDYGEASFVYSKVARYGKGIVWPAVPRRLLDPGVYPKYKSLLNVVTEWNPDNPDKPDVFTARNYVVCLCVCCTPNTSQPPPHTHAINRKLWCISITATLRREKQLNCFVMPKFLSRCTTPPALTRRWTSGRPTTWLRN